MTVEELIEKLKEFPYDMEVCIGYAGEKAGEVLISTWVHNNYPYDEPDKDYVVIR